VRVVFDKSSKNPVVGPGIGPCFDVSVLFDQGRYRMWFSWRAKKAIALVESSDGETWNMPPKIVIAAPSPLRRKLFLSECHDVSRPCVIFHKGQYHLWYCIHAKTISIAYAVSNDGVSWKHLNKAALLPELPWEKDALMGPCVIYDEQERVFKMWYSGGGQYEPDAIGYATSIDGVAWKKHPSNPIFIGDPSAPWEKDRAVGMHVMQSEGYYLGFYIGFANGFEKSCIGLARSKNGITGWERHAGNPIITPGAAGTWEDCNVYRPYVIHQKDKWMLWYNASRFSDRVEQIGVATCEQLKFEQVTPIHSEPLEKPYAT
jgi:predicted GH43/DUF377 family glycosyl hydrolase